MPSEWVVGMTRNRWTASIGIDGRHGPDYAQLAEADLAIENFREGVFVFGAFQVQFGHTAKPGGG
jgi:hypothetical protein